MAASVAVIGASPIAISDVNRSSTSDDESDEARNQRDDHTFNHYGRDEDDHRDRQTKACVCPGLSPHWMTRAGVPDDAGDHRTADTRSPSHLRPATTLEVLETSAKVSDVVIESRAHGQPVTRTVSATERFTASLMDQAHLLEHSSNRTVTTRRHHLGRMPNGARR
jgi:hypothetical protein